MKKTSDKSHPPAEIGDIVIIPFPDLYRTKGDLQTIIGVVLQINDNELYNIMAKHGVLQIL